MKKRKNTESSPTSNGWTFLSNHAHVLICLARRPDERLRDVSMEVGITERAVQKIVADLEEAGILSRHKDGRRNHYNVHAERYLRHPVEAHCRVASLLEMVIGGKTNWGRQGGHPDISADR